MKKQSQTDLLTGPVFRTLIGFSAPFVLATMLQTLYSTVDMIIVGNVVGAAGLSALSTGSQLMEMIMVFCMGFSSAGQVIIAQYVGAGKREEIVRINGTLSTLMLLLAIGMTLVGLLGGNLFLLWLNVPEEAVLYAQQYVRVCSFGIIFTGLYNMISAVFRGMGDSRHPLIFIAVASILNIILDLVFVAGFGWGAAGAALATVIGQAVSVICSVVFLVRNQKAFCFSFRPESFRPDGEITAKLVRLGIPMALQVGAIYISFLFVSGMINGLGVTVAAAFGVNTKLRNIPGILNSALSMGCTAMMGQNIGAGKTERVKEIFKGSCVLTAIISAVFAVLFLAVPELCYRIFTQDTPVLEYAAMGCLCLAIELPAKVFMPSGGALVSASGNVRLSFILAMVDAFVGRVFLTWLLGKAMGLGTFGYFLGYVLATYCTSVPQLIYFMTGAWERRKRLTE